MPSTLGRQSMFGKLTAILSLCSLIDTARGQRTWIYTMVSSDYGGDLLLPHFVNHYHQLGITYRRFLVLVHHTPGKHPRAALEKITGICQGYSLECRLWEGEYNPDEQYERHLRILNDFVLDPYDWIVIADSDELQVWPGMIRDELDRLSQVGRKKMRTYSHVEGYLVDRIAPAGRIEPIKPVSQRASTPPLFRQFPLQCTPLGQRKSSTEEHASTSAPAPGRKIVAFRNFIRVSRGWHRVVTPDRSKGYFSGCSAGAKCMRGTLEGGASDIFNLTPYYRDPDRYKYSYAPKDVRSHAGAGPKFKLAIWSDTVVPVHHFRWHNGSLLEMHAYLERYRGTCDVESVLSVQQWNALPKGCIPLLFEWGDVAKQLHEARTGQLDLGGTTCIEEQQEEEGATDTSYMGLAWEEFDAALNVSAKIRNTVKGDSQTRMASLTAAHVNKEETS